MRLVSASFEHDLILISKGKSNFNDSKNLFIVKEYYAKFNFKLGLSDICTFLCRLMDYFRNLL